MNNKTESQDIATGAPDLDKLEALALSYTYENGDHWYCLPQIADGITYEPAADFITNFSPATALTLIELARRAQPAGAGELADERALFEATEPGSHLVQRDDGEYENPLVQSAWEGWQKGRAALTHPSVSASPAMSNADAAQWARENGLNVPPQWEAAQQPSAAPSVQPAGAPAQAQPDERALFEAAFIARIKARDPLRKYGEEDIAMYLARNSNDESRYLHAQEAWEGWQARAALSASPSAPAMQAETRPEYRTVTDHNGRVVGVRMTNPEDMPLYTGAAPAGAAQAELDKSAINKLWASARDVLAELFSAASKYKAAIESDTLGDQNEEDLTEALADSEHWLFTNIAASARDTQQASMADAYAGAREDFAIWKKRALEAEESCRRLTAALNAEPASAAQTTTASASDELLPCPFCGGKAEYVSQHDDRGNAAIECVECGANTAANMPPVGERWNRRAPAPSRSAAPAESASAAEAWKVGNLLTMSDSDYPDMGSMFAQVWQGDDLIARVYGDSAEEVRERAARVAGVAAPDGGEDARDERALFEAYYQSRAEPLRYPHEYFALVEKVVDGGDIVQIYEHDWMQKHWEVWQARAALSTMQQSTDAGGA